MLSEQIDPLPLAEALEGLMEASSQPSTQSQFPPAQDRGQLTTQPPVQKYSLRQQPAGESTNTMTGTEGCRLQLTIPEDQSSKFSARMRSTAHRVTGPVLSARTGNPRWIAGLRISLKEHPKEEAQQIAEEHSPPFNGTVLLIGS